MFLNLCKMAEQLLFKSMSVLKCPNVFMKNSTEVEKKLLAFIQGGVNQLQIITDFDETITKQKPLSGKSVLTSVLHACPSLPDSYKIQSKALYDKYHPYECDHKLDKTIKTNIMLKWWEEESEILKNIFLPQQEFEDVAQNSYDKLRDNTFEMLNYAKEHKIPVLIFSAGVGNSIIAILKVNRLMLKNITIVSNFLKYKTGDIIDGFQNPLIHILNKNDYILKNSNHYQQVYEEKPNILLLGDAIGDAEMAADKPKQTVLRIGFIKGNDKRTIELFSNEFDILLIDDQSMNVPLELLKLIPKK
ncbi:7-methylguanosine phosphate-specific 5'-nucleotidase isoform X2 [Chrysoperla carnea]|uniref:7-methylguanosine phosphate-specific 5'-nucleotidase isoform X2 n=1 Tax=Chrysoperla carnea TaxID=189513 RepID=UPI001D090A5B|nr:7-methylguanosine phosphate-specific 5'-nucleotidase isoform X2 [Chrysoperla carnea]